MDWIDPKKWKNSEINKKENTIDLWFKIEHYARLKKDLKPAHFLCSIAQPCYAYIGKNQNK